MTCPVCGGKTLVVYCLSEEDLVARRRQCAECNYIFYTSEIELNDSRDDYNRLVRAKEAERRKKRGVKKCEK